MTRFHEGFLLVAMVLMKCVISTKAESDPCLAEAKKLNVAIVKEGNSYKCEDGTDGSVTCDATNGQVTRFLATCKKAGCHCNSMGTPHYYSTVELHTYCNNYGNCPCQSGVIGRNCDRCAPGWFGITVPQGDKDSVCQVCDCDREGSMSTVCDEYQFGQCKCKENFIGRKCDQNGVASHHLGLLGLVSFFLVFLCI